MSLPQPCPPAGPLLGRTVLVVEDHNDSREMVRQMLESVGVHVLGAANGREALAILSRETPDVVLCDLRMPVMDGFEFMAHLRGDQARARLKVVALTALGAQSDLMKTWQAGFDGHLVKPFDYETLLAFVGDLAQPPRSRSPRRRGNRRIPRHGARP